MTNYYIFKHMFFPKLQLKNNNMILRVSPRHHPIDAEIPPLWNSYSLFHPHPQEFSFKNQMLPGRAHP